MLPRQERQVALASSACFHPLSKLLHPKSKKKVLADAILLFSFILTRVFGVLPTWRFKESSVEEKAPSFINV